MTSVRCTSTCLTKEVKLGNRLLILFAKPHKKRFHVLPHRDGLDDHESDDGGYYNRHGTQYESGSSFGGLQKQCAYTPCKEVIFTCEILRD